MPDIVLALCTVPAGFDVPPLARDLLARRLVACVSVVPAVQSMYTWNGAVEESTEQQLLFKTTQDRVDALWTAVKSAHPYDVPEFLVIPVEAGNPDYLAWVARGTTS